MDQKPFALAVRVILFDQQGKILLLQRSEKSKTNPGKWELPGGKIDPGESFDTALKREILEETGLEVHIHHAAGTAEQQVPSWHVIHLVMTGSIASGFPKVSDEHVAFRWSGIEDLSDLDLADWFEEFVKKSSQNVHC